MPRHVDLVRRLWPSTPLVEKDVNANRCEYQKDRAVHEFDHPPPRLPRFHPYGDPGVPGGSPGGGKGDPGNPGGGGGDDGGGNGDPGNPGGGGGGGGLLTSNVPDQGQGGLPSTAYAHSSNQVCG